MTLIQNALHPRYPALSMMTAMLIFGIIDSAVALIAQSVSVWQFFAVRSLMALPLVALVAVVTGMRLRPVRWWAVTVRSLLMASGMAFYFTSLGFMPFAQALAGLFTAPIFVLLITVVGLRQRIGPYRIIAVALGFCGVLLVQQPWSDAFHPALLLPIFGAFLYACSSVATRALCADEGMLSLLTGIFLAQGIFGALVLIWLGEGAAAPDFITRGWTWEMGPALPWIAMQAVFSLIGLGLITWAYQNGEASRVAIFEYSVFLWGPLVAFIGFGQTVSPLAMLGIVLVALAGIIIALRSG